MEELERNKQEKKKRHRRKIHIEETFLNRKGNTMNREITRIKKIIAFDVICFSIVLFLTMIQVNKLEKRVDELQTSMETTLTETKTETTETETTETETESETKMEIETNDYVHIHNGYVYIECTVTELNWETFTVLLPNGTLETFNMVSDPPIDEEGNPWITVVWFRVSTELYNDLNAWEVISLE